MSSYRAHRAIGVIRLADGAHLLPNRSNPDWQDYLVWLADGGTPLPAEDPAEPRAQVEARLWSQIKQVRARIKAGGVLVAGKWYHSDESSRVQQIGLCMMGAAVPAVAWKTMDGSFVTMTPAIAAGIFAATATLDMAAFSAAEGHRAALLAAADPAAYDYSAGWPAIYGG